MPDAREDPEGAAEGAATAGPRSEPANALPAGVRRMWVAEALVIALATLAGSFALAAAIDVLMPWLPLAVAAGAVALVAVVPRSHRRYRWSLCDEELDLLYGAWSETRTIVPLTRIQHVSVERTGWTDLFSLVRLHVHTAAGKTTIPGLERAEADVVRDRILARLRAPDDL